MVLPQIKESWSRSSSTPVQTASDIVVALAAVFSVLLQSKDRTVSWVLAALAVFLFVRDYGKRIYGHSAQMKEAATGSIAALKERAQAGGIPFHVTKLTQLNLRVAH